MEWVVGIVWNSQHIVEPRCTISGKNPNWLYLGNNCINNNAQGKGSAISADGKMAFEGHFSKGSPLEGTITYFSGARYEGPLHNGKPHGNGRYLRSSGLPGYNGSFVDGKRHGEGMCWHQNNPEHCEYHEGSRIDEVYRIRQEIDRQEQLLADREYERIRSEIEQEEEFEERERQRKEEEEEWERQNKVVDRSNKWLGAVVTGLESMERSLQDQFQQESEQRERNRRYKEEQAERSRRRMEEQQRQYKSYSNSNQNNRQLRKQQELLRNKQEEQKQKLQNTISRLRRECEASGGKYQTKDNTCHRPPLQISVPGNFAIAKDDGTLEEKALYRKSFYNESSAAKNNPGTNISKRKSNQNQRSSPDNLSKQPEKYIPKLEYLAYCWPTKSGKNWICTGKIQNTLIGDSFQVSSEQVGCSNIRKKVPFKKGYVLFCNEPILAENTGKTTWTRDITQWYSFPREILNARKTFSCQDNCSSYSRCCQ